MDFSWLPQPRFVPIPRAFHSLEKDGPFERCVQCDAELLTSGRPYLIERVFRGTEPIIEYALCESCVEKAQQELSQESKEAVAKYLAEHVDFAARLERLNEVAGVKDEDLDAESWFDHCAVSGQSAAHTRERQIAAWCQGSQMRIDHALPLMLAGPALEELQEVLSEKTRGWMNDFVSDNFGMPPEFCDQPDIRPILL